MINWVLIASGGLVVWLGVLTWFVIKSTNHYRRLTAGVTKNDLKEILEKLIKSVKDTSARQNNLLKTIDELRREDHFHLQKIGLVRYNPFAETGGNQSFCLAVMDNEDNGLVISSLHSRDTTRVYAKPVKKGKAAGFEFSQEEMRAIKEAKKNK